MANGHGGKRRGAGRKPRHIERQIELVEGYSLDYAMKIYEGDDEHKKFVLTKDLAGKIIARRVKLGGNENDPIKVNIIVQRQDGSKV